MRFLKLKIIIPSILGIVLLVALGLFFIGGLKAANLEFDNVEYTKDDSYLFYEQILEDEQFIGRMGNGSYASKCLVTHTDKFALVIDVNTTIISLVEKNEAWSEANFMSGKVYDTANAKGSGAEQANIILNYFAENGKASSAALNSYTNSVSYRDNIAGATYKYYRLKLLTDEANSVYGVDILYQIGSFNNADASYPPYFVRDDFYDTFIGNMYFYIPRMSELDDYLYDVDSKLSHELIAANGYVGSFEDWESVLSLASITATSININKLEDKDPSYVYDYIRQNGYFGTFKEWSDFCNSYEKLFDNDSSYSETSTEVDYIYDYIARNGFQLDRTSFMEDLESFDNTKYKQLSIQPIELSIGRSVSGIEAYDKAVAGGYTGSASMWATELTKFKLTYTGRAYLNDAECAAYLEEKGYQVTPQNSSYSNYVDENGGSFGGYWYVDGIANEDGTLKLESGVDYNSETSPCVINPFSNSYIIENIWLDSYSLVTPQEDSKFYDPNNKFGNMNKLEWTTSSPPILKRTVYNNNSLSILNNTMYNVETALVNEEGVVLGNYFFIDDYMSLYQYYPVYHDYNKDGKLTNDEIVQMGGFQAKDEAGVWQYQDGKPVSNAFNLALAGKQNAEFGNEAASSSSAFEVCLRVTLDEKGLKATVINDSIVETNITAERYQASSSGEGEVISQKIDHKNKLFEIQVFPYMTANNDNLSTGQIVIPDGSGVTISFNSIKDKQHVGKYKKHVYGLDTTLPLKKAPENDYNIMFGMFGYLDFTNSKGIVAAVEKGASLTSIEADFYRSVSTGGKYNYARFITTLREQEVVSISTGTEFNKWTEDFYQGDLSYIFMPITDYEGEKFDYVDVANVYRNYLVDKYSLQEKKDTTTDHALNIYFLGQFDKKEIGFGFVYDADKSLTTFQQAIEIISELEENGVEDFNVAYSSWTKKGMQNEVSAKAKTSKVLGGKSDLEELASYLKENSYGFYPEYTLTRGWGYDFAFGTLKYSPKSVGSTYSVVSQFVVATGLADADRKNGGYVSPRFYMSLALKYIANYSKLGIEGIALSDVGNTRTADYSRKSLLYTETSANIQKQVLAEFDKEQEILLYSPFDYALPYASTIMDAPLTATMLPIVDYSVPLYQLVVSGLVDYAGEPVNYGSSHSTTWYLLKSIETGSNLQFYLSAEDTSVLLDTHYTDYYNAYYRNWKQTIIQMNKTLSDLGIYESRLVDHEYISDNVVKVTYENGLTILINFDKDIYYDTTSGTSIASNWFAVVEKGA